MQLTRPAAMEIKRLRAIKDGWGKCVYSREAVAKMLGTSPSTVARVETQSTLKFKDLPEVSDLDLRAKESEERFLQSMADKFTREITAKTPEHVNSLLDELDAGV